MFSWRVDFSVALIKRLISSFVNGSPKTSSLEPVQPLPHPAAAERARGNPSPSSPILTLVMLSTAVKRRVRHVSSSISWSVRRRRLNLSALALFQREKRSSVEERSRVGFGLTGGENMGN